MEENRATIDQLKIPRSIYTFRQRSLATCSNPTLLSSFDAPWIRLYRAFLGVILWFLSVFSHLLFSRKYIAAKYPLMSSQWRA
jgi:hypothetical protein